MNESRHPGDCMRLEWIRQTWLRLRMLRRRRSLDRDLEEELAFHLKKAAEKNRQLGIDPEEAGYAARRQFGNAAVRVPDLGYGDFHYRSSRIGCASRSSDPSESY